MTLQHWWQRLWGSLLWVMSHVWIRYESCHTCEYEDGRPRDESHTKYTCRHITMIISISGTGWRRPVWCLKLSVIFRKSATNYRAFLRKLTGKIRHPMGLHQTVWVMSYMWMSPESFPWTHMGRSRFKSHIYEFVDDSDSTIDDDDLRYESCLTYGGGISHVTHMYESCHTYEWVMSHV